MSDFRVQYVSGTVPTGVTQYELLAPEWFQPLSALSRTFILPATTMQTVGIGSVGGSTNIRDWALNCDINFTNQILLNRGAANGPCEFAFYIIEYMGIAGGPNEFIMRGRRITPFNPDATLTADSNPISGITNIARCVPFINGRHDGTGTAALRHFMADARVASSGSNGIINYTRALGTNGDPTYVCYCVEFTGSNWSIQTGTASNWTANTNKDTPITPVASLPRSWVYGHYVPGNRDTPAGGTWFAWLSSAGNLRTRTIEVSTISSARFWVLQNSASTFGVSVVNAVNGTNDWLASASPQTQTVTVPTMASAGVAITGWAGSSTTNTNQNPAGVWRLRRFSATEVQAYRTNGSGNTEYILQILSFPVDPDTSLVIAPAPAVLSLQGRLVNTPLTIAPARAMLSFLTFPPFSQVVRQPITAALSLLGYQPITTRLFPGAAALSFENGVISQEREIILQIPMPDLTYTETPNNPPTVTVGGGASPATAVLSLQSLAQSVGEGGNIKILEPATSGLSFVGQLSVVGLEGAATGALSVAGLAPDITGTEVLIEPGLAELQLVIVPFDPSFVFVPYQWIDVDPAPVVQWS